MAHFACAGLKHGRRLSVDCLPATRSDGDKPDFKELDLTSPAVSMSPTTSSSSYSDSNRRRRPGHARSRSTSSATSQVFRSGNICPLGRIEGVAGSCGPGCGVASGGEHSGCGGGGDGEEGDSERRSKEVRRLGNELYKRGRFAEALVLYDAVCRSNRAAALIGRWWSASWRLGWIRRSGAHTNGSLFFFIGVMEQETDFHYCGRAPITVIILATYLGHTCYTCGMHQTMFHL